MITPENISRWFDSNYVSLTKTEHTYLAGPQREAALKQVLRYADRQHGDWSMIQQAEVDVSLVKPDYIIEGKVDLIRGEGDTVEIVDFKSQRKPDIMKDREAIILRTEARMMETRVKPGQQTTIPSEAIGILMEISNVSRRLACNLARLVEQERCEGGTPDEQDVRTGCCHCRAAQMRRNTYRCF